LSYARILEEPIAMIFDWTAPQDLLASGGMPGGSWQTARLPGVHFFRDSL